MPAALKELKPQSAQPKGLADYAQNRIENLIPNAYNACISTKTILKLN